MKIYAYVDRQTDRWRDRLIYCQKGKQKCESMKEIVIKYMLSLKAQNVTSVSYQTVKKAMINLMKVQYYESKFL